MHALPQAGDGQAAERYAHLLRDVKDLDKAFPEDPEVQAFVEALVPQLARALRLRGLGLTRRQFLSKDYVNLAYSSPDQRVAPLAGAATVNVAVEVTDVRADKQRVSCKKNGYGMEMAPILAKNDVAAVVSNAVQTELRQRGFKTEGGNIRVGVELSKFYNDFKIGFWSGSAVSEVALNVHVKKPDGNIVYTKSVAGTCTKKGVMMCSGANAKESLEAALKDAVGKLMSDTAFTTALVQAGV